MLSLPPSLTLPPPTLLLLSLSLSISLPLFPPLLPSFPPTHLPLSPSDVIDERIVRHQVKYLGLMENLRVRRAGFCYRRQFPVFLGRYKCLCPATWPHWDGPLKEGVETLCKHLGYTSEQYKTGK